MTSAWAVPADVRQAPQSDGETSSLFVLECAAHPDGRGLAQILLALRLACTLADVSPAGVHVDSAAVSGRWVVVPCEPVDGATWRRVATKLAGLRTVDSSSPALARSEFAVPVERLWWARD